MDVDGTLTDGKIYMSASGELMKAFNVKDGCGIHDILIPAGITPVILTGRQSEIVAMRCKELGIVHIYQGVADKVRKISELFANFSVVAYIGDDINDFSCMTAVKAASGIIACPADAAEKIKQIVDFIAPHKGGEGAVRDFIEWIVK